MGRRLPPTARHRTPRRPSRSLWLLQKTARSGKRPVLSRRPVASYLGTARKRRSFHHRPAGIHTTPAAPGPGRSQAPSPRRPGLPTTLNTSDSDGGAETQITFTRIIVHPGGHREIEGATPKALPAPEPDETKAIEP